MYIPIFDTPTTKKERKSPIKPGLLRFLPSFYGVVFFISSCLIFGFGAFCF